ncbi:MAG: IclR family transcriptional regulator [Christensenellales bacterium]
MDKDKEINNGYLLGSLSQSLELIDYLADNEYSTLTQIAQALGLSKTVVFRQLYTLQHHGFVFRSGASTYTLGHRFVFLGQKVLRQNTLHQRVKGALGDLTARFNETSHMGILDDETRVLIVSKVNADVTMQMTSNIGKTLQAYCSAMGKCLLAHGDETLRRRYFAGRMLCKYAANTITEPDDFEREFAAIRQFGYSLDNEESEEGLFCVAVPVRDKQGRVYAAISLSGPVGRMQGKIQPMIESLQATARGISLLTEPVSAKS